MSRQSDDKPVEDRRDFLKLATLGTVLGGAAIVAGGTAENASAAELKSGGYRETEHIKTYYKLLRF
ncbi:MAG TPA: twin-arginine translocation signal domain-containing protein [Hyphomicrobiales bacterium]|nr:twin-arginine translocation signal domain-containing protein [Hyphomicrobiales bacterium]